MIDGLLIAFIVAFLRRGRLRGWASLDVRGTEWLLFGIVLQYGTVYLALQQIDFFITYGPYLFVGSFVPTLYGAWVSRQLPGMHLIGIGIILNLIVIAANGGSMPVSIPAADAAGLTRAAVHLNNPEYIKHSAMHADTRFKWLADIIPLPRPYPRPGVASIGDVVTAVGIFILVQYAMVTGNTSRRDGDQELSPT